jgi:AraC-like DNA-binding protein
MMARPDILWQAPDGLMLFAGPLGRHARHCHGAPTFLAGLYGSFRLRCYDGEWRTVRTAVLPAGTPHELDAGGQPLAVFNVEPGLGDVKALMLLVRHGDQVDGALVGAAGEISFMRDLYERRSAGQGAPSDMGQSALEDLVASSRRRAKAEPIDPRIRSVVEDISQHCDDLAPAVRVAARLGLSSSRFQHLFTQQVGVPYRSYRRWARLRGAIREIVQGANLTTAAHAAGFSDSSHLAHEFRRITGASPTQVLRGGASPHGAEQ